MCIIPALRFRRRQLINGNIAEQQLAATLSHQIDPLDGALIEAHYGVTVINDCEFTSPLI